jgi:hypothetical protein
MTTTTPDVSGANGLFHVGAQWRDMDAWHEHVSQIRRTTPVLRVDAEGFAPFWVLTKHEDVFAVSRDDASPAAPPGADRRAAQRW